MASTAPPTRKRRGATIAPVPERVAAASRPASPTMPRTLSRKTV